MSSNFLNKLLFCSIIDPLQWFNDNLIIVELTSQIFHYFIH